MSGAKQPLWRWRLFIGWAAVTAFAGAIGCLAPLLSTLGYEYSLLISLVAALGAGHLAAAYPERVRTQRAPFPGARFTAVILYARASFPGLGLLLPPLLLALLNGLRVAPCNLPEGFAFYLLLPLPSVLIATGVGLCCGLATPGARSASVIWFAVYAASLGTALYRAYSTPAVFAFGPFFGYFPGVLYDELIRISTRLVTYRIVTVLQIAALLAFAAWLLDPATLRLSVRRLRARRRTWLPAVTLAAAVLGAYLLGPTLGHRSSRAGLERLLPQRVDAGRLELFFPAGASPTTVGQLTDDAAFSLHQVEQFLGASGDVEIAVFFFEDQGQKAAAMGAARTNVAKPWRREIYVVLDAAPHQVLRHELAHAVSADFGRGPFAIAGSFGGWWPNPGLIEGLAAAAQGPRGDLTLHQWSAAMQRVDILPDLERIFDFGFLDLPASTAYTAAGSFCRWIVEEHGAAALRQVYGGASWSRATGQDLAQLTGRWVDFLKQVALEPRDLAAASHRFDRPSVIRTTCVHEVARLRRAASRAAGRGCHAESIDWLERAYERSGRSTESWLGLFNGLAAAGQHERLRGLAEQMLEDPSVSSVQRHAIREVRADLRAPDHLVEAGRRFTELALEAPNEDSRRRLLVKAHLAGLGAEVGGPVLAVLRLQPGPDRQPEPLAMLAIAEAARRAPRDPVLSYLLARQHFRYDDHAGALRVLAETERLGLAELPPSIRLAARQLRARALFGLGRYPEARQEFVLLAADESLRSGVREEARDWVARADFYSKKWRWVTRGAGR